MNSLKTDVERALRNAVDNGYDEVLTDPPEKVAADLGTYCPDVEGQPVDLLAPLVKRWQEHHRSEA